jgi:hypothetical protein
MIKNKIRLYGFLLLGLVIVRAGYASSMLSMPLPAQSPAREQVTKVFDEKKYLQDKLTYERGYTHLQEIVKELLVIIKQKYSSIISGRGAYVSGKNPKIVSDYASGRYLKNILMQK